MLVRWWFLASLALLVLGSACRPPAPSSAPPPQGRAYDDYLTEAEPKAEVAPEPRAQVSVRDALVVHFIDVGQGAATLVELPCGAILIDTGGEKNQLFDSEPALLGYLNQFFARRTDLDRTIDTLVITHPHVDHTRSIPAVLRQYKVRNIVDNGDVREDIGGMPQIHMHSWLHDQNLRIAEHNRKVGQRPNRKGRRARGARPLPPIGHLDVSSADVGPTGLHSPVVDSIPACPRSEVDPVIRVLWGSRSGREEKGHNPNNDSVVLRVDYGASSALLTGDLEMLSLAWLTKHYATNPHLLDADVYYVPHHGSRNSSAEHFIDLVTPKVAVISMGPYARKLGTRPEYSARAFGHPNVNSIDHLTSAAGAVSLDRAQPIEVKIGQKGAWAERDSVFETRTIDKAIYATGWDGHVVVSAYEDGRIEVQTSGRTPAETEPPATADASH